MRFTSLRMRGLLNFPDEIAVDFEALPPVIAIVGPNGAGKTTFTRALLTAVSRTALPLATLARLGGRGQAEVEVGLSTDRAWRVQHRLDAAGGRAESQVFDDSGASVLPTPSVRAFDAFAARTFPELGVLLAGPFAGQADPGFLGMTPGDRKAIVLRAKAAEKIEGFAAQARESARARQGALDVVLARLGDERRRAGLAIDSIDLIAGTAATIETKIASAAAAEQLASQALEQARAAEKAAVGALEGARAEASAIAAHNASAATSRAEIAAADEAVRVAEAHLERLRATLGTHQALLSEAEAIRESEAMQRVLDGEIVKHVYRVSDLQAAARASEARVAELRAAVGRAQATVGHAAAKANEAAERAKQRAAAALEAERLPAAREALAHAEADVAAAEAEIERLHALAAQGAEGRIGGLRGTLQAIATDDARGCQQATEGLGRDDAAKAAIDALPADQRRAAEARAAALDARKRAQLEMQRLDGRRALAEAPHDDAAAATALQEATAAQAQAEQAQAEAEGQREQIVVDLAEASAKRDALMADRKAETRGDKLVSLVAAEAASAQIASEIAAGAEALETARAKRVAMGDAPPLRSAPDLGVLEKAAASATEAVHVRQSALREAERSVQEIGAAAERLAAIEAERLAVATDLGDWSRLARDLGREGLQAMLVDAIGPELTDLTNDLLHSCVGPRFTVQVDTQRASADGRKMLEGCDVTVYDTRKGVLAQDGDTLSGGEAVLVGTPLRLALAHVTCRTWGIRRPTIVLDESGASLDESLAAGPYVAMLRRAAAQMQGQVLFITHNAEAARLADARLVIGGGRVEVN